MKVLKEKIANLISSDSPVQLISVGTQVPQESFKREKCSADPVIYGLSESLSSLITQRITEDSFRENYRVNRYFRNYYLKCSTP